jgi:hypothetical protein
MSNAKDDPKSKQPPDKSSATVGGRDAGTEKRSGRVAYDSRGNPIWEWQLETGVYSRDVSTQKLKKLDLGELSIAETAIQRRPAGLQEPPKRTADQGFNPYNNSGTKPRDLSSYDKARAAASKTPPKASTPARTPEDMRKLDEWIRQKKNAKDNKD